MREDPETHRWKITGFGGRLPGGMILGILLLLSAPLLFIGLQSAGWADNEGRYAEVAREMLDTGDWITPRLNGGVFLNKPPLLFWLTALSFQGWGLNENARWISGLATLLTTGLLFLLARRIWNARAGLWSAVVFLTSALTTIEGRLLRPDALLVLWLLLTLWGVLRITESPHDRWGTVAIGTGIGFGMLTKGLIALLLPVLAFLPAYTLARPRPGLGAYFSPWSLALILAIVLPWHIAAGLANPGFWWDYVVNQHVLFFFDRKLPRDSVPHPLWFAWMILGFRLLPWLLLLPVAFRRQWQAALQSGRLMDWLPLTWFLSVVLFFSLAMGRLEHHFIPAVPAAALLVGSWCAAVWEGAPVPGRECTVVGLTLTTLAGVATVGLLLASPLLEAVGLLSAHPGLLTIARGAMLSVAVGSGVAAVLWFRRTSSSLAVLAVTFAVFAGWTVAGFAATEQRFSVRTLVRNTDPALLQTSNLAYEPGQEYQLCGALNFYLRRRLVLLEPPGFVPPPYFDEEARRMFVSREEFSREWRDTSRPWLLFTDPEKPLNRHDEYPWPYTVVGQGGGRLLLLNRETAPRAMTRP